MSITNRNLETIEAPTIQLKIGEVAKISGISIDTLRFYEKRGLLGRTARSKSGYRLYGIPVIERLLFIKKAQTLGFTLDEIHALIKIKSEGQSPCDEVRSLVRKRLEELTAHIENLIEYRDELSASLS